MRLAAAVLLTLALGACADPATVRPGAGGSSSPAGPSYAADAVVLQVSYGGGLLPRDHLPEPPYWTLYGDGRVITRGPEPAIYPGQAVPNLTAAEGDGGFGTVRDEEPYVPTALAVVARTPYRGDPQGIEEQVQTWDGPALTPGYDVPTGAGTCTVVTGADLAAVLPDVRKANTLTRWQHDGKDWTLRFRPLLPDERTCADAYPA